MRFMWLLVLSACAGAAGPPTRRIVVEPDEDGSSVDERRCQERCAAYVHAGEQVSCEGASLYALEERLGYRTAVVCVVRPREGG